MADRASDHGVYLLWIPLGAGSSVPVVRWNGRVYEAVSARRAHRAPRDLYHAALEIGVPEGRYVVEMTPAWGPGHSRRGTVASGPVGWKPLGRSRLFRYEVHCWRDGVIPDRAYAVGGSRRLTTDAEIAGRVLKLAPAFPTAVWGRDEFGTGDMWNSNSLVSWLLSCAGFPTEQIDPPPNGRAPGWRAGLMVATTRPEASPRRAGHCRSDAMPRA